MKKFLLQTGLICFALLILATPAFAWGSATHAYLDDHLGLIRQPANLNEIYGGMAADTFNTLFSEPVRMQILSTLTHEAPEALWAQAHNQPEREVAFGFVSHNDLWGADATAHRDGQTFGQGEGYIIAKAQLLLADLNTIPEFAAMQLPPEVALLVSHIIVEYGIDQLIVNLDPRIGAKITAAAIRRSHFFPQLLTGAYGAALTGMDPEEQAAYLAALEQSFRQSMILYGQALQQEPALSRQLVTAQLVDMAKAFLQMYQVKVPSDTVLRTLIAVAMEDAMQLCSGPDGNFVAELAATRTYVARGLRQHEVGYPARQ